jgi:hypothetical protein
LALLAGRLICRGGGSAFDPIFNLKMVAGYVVFGFAAAGVLFLLYAVFLAVQAIRARSTLEKLYGTAGLFAFLLPVLFFLPQLHTPRYFWRGCEAILLLAVSTRRPVWNIRWLKITVCFAATIPLVLGLRLPELTQPRLTVTHPELFPSGDGFYPMGGILPFMFRLRNAVEQPVDHNQQVWNAVRKADLRFDDRRSIKVLHTPMYGYFMLAASLRGGFAECRSYAELSNGCFYADSRSLMRDDPKTPIYSLKEILSLPAHFVSPVSDGIGILEFGTGDNRWGSQTRLLNRLFAGNEYRILTVGKAGIPTRATIAFSRQSFDGARKDDQTGLYYFEEQVPCSSLGLYYASTILPSWMSLQSFKGSGQ